MPSFRDLDGNEVDEVVDSRLSQGPSPAAVDPGPAMVERAEVRAAVLKMTASRRTRVGDVLLEPADPPRTSDPPRAMVLPPDVEAGLAALEDTLQTMDALVLELTQAAARARDQMEAVRLRAQQDADKLAKIDAALRVLQG